MTKDFFESTRNNNNYNINTDFKYVNNPIANTSYPYEYRFTSKFTNFRKKFFSKEQTLYDIVTL